MKNKTQKTNVFAGFCLVLGLFLAMGTTAYALDLGVGTDTSGGAGGSLTGVVFSPTVEVGTSATLKTAVDAILEKTAGASDDAFCATLDSAVQGLSTAENGSLAWNKGSYEGNVSLDADASVSADQKTQYDSLKSAYKDVNDGLASSVDANNGTSLRAGAAVRSAYLELLAEYRTGTASDDHASALKSFIDKAKVCVSKGDIPSLGSALGTIAASTNATATPAEEPTIVTKADISTDATVTPISLAKVSSKAQFSDFAKTVIAKNDAVVSVSGSTASVMVAVKEKGKLFAFIPVMMNVTTTVAPAGAVTVHYPWYRFLARIENKVTSVMVLDALPKEVTDSTTEFSAHAQAAAVDAVVSAFASVAAPATSATATTNATSSAATGI